MAFTRREPKLEQWLQHRANSYRAVTDAEYRSLVAKWKERFELCISANAQASIGARAYEDVNVRLPLEGFMFRMPGYRGLPAPARGGSAFGYEFVGLRNVNHDLLNDRDVVIVDAEFTFTCMYTHEAARMAQAEFYLRLSDEC